MNLRFIRSQMLLSTAVLVTAANPVVRADDTAWPTTDDLTAALAAKDYAAALSGASRILALRGGPIAAGYHRSTIWTIKAESLAATGKFGPAIDAFSAAVREKDATPGQQTLSLATAALLKVSTPAGYTPRAAANDGAAAKDGAASVPARCYDVLDPAQRRAAFAQLTQADQADIAARVDDMIRFSDDKILGHVGEFRKCVTYIDDRRPVERAAARSARAATDRLDAQEIRLDQRYVAAACAWHDATMPVLAKLAALEQQTVPSKDAAPGKPATVRRGLTLTELDQVKVLLDQCATRIDQHKKLAAVSSEVGRAVVKSAEPDIQEVYDTCHQVYDQGKLPRSKARPW